MCLTKRWRSIPFFSRFLGSSLLLSTTTWRSTTSAWFWSYKEHNLSFLNIFSAWVLRWLFTASNHRSLSIPISPLTIINVVWDLRSGQAEFFNFLNISSLVWSPHMVIFVWHSLMRFFRPMHLTRFWLQTVTAGKEILFSCWTVTDVVTG